MAITIVHGTPQLIWAPIWNATAADTLYVGQLVCPGPEGVQPLRSPNGAADYISRGETVGVSGSSSGNNVPFGLIVGTNRKTPSYDSTALADGVLYTSPASASAEDYVMVEGPWAKGDRMAMVQIALLNPSITLRAPLYEDTIGTAPTVDTLSGTPTTVTATSSATAEAGILGFSTVYFRTGTIAGTYRVTDDTSTTAITWDIPTVQAAAAGDTIVRVNLRPWGTCRCAFGTEAMWIDTGATLTTNYFLIDVCRLDLSTAGAEYVDFKFNAVHYNANINGTSS